MIVSGRVIPYFMAYRIIYITWKTKCDRQKQIVDLESTSKNESNCPKDSFFSDTVQKHLSGYVII